MKVFYTRTHNICGKNGKKQEIIERCAKELHFDEMAFFWYPDKVDTDNELKVRMDGITASMDEDSIVIFQYPSMISMRYDGAVVEKIKRYENAKLIILVEDFGYEVLPETYEGLKDEINILNNADLLILQSEIMKKELVENGLKDIPIIYQQMWDYPYGLSNKVKIEKRIETISDISIINMIDKEKSGFCLIDESDKYNPLEMGFCICAGIPVIAQKDSRIGKIVREYNIGFEVNQSENIQQLLEKLSNDEINTVLFRINKMKSAVENGFFSKKMLQNAVFKVIEKGFTD